MRHYAIKKNTQCRNYENFLYYCFDKNFVKAPILLGKLITVDFTKCFVGESESEFHLQMESKFGALMQNEKKIELSSIGIMRHFFVRNQIFFRNHAP